MKAVNQFTLSMIVPLKMLIFEGLISTYDE